MPPGEAIHREYQKEIDFENIARRSADFARHIDENQHQIVDALLDYETYEVAMDEIARSRDLLLNLRENKNYFRREVGPVTSFLPSNQPLYSLTSFSVVPSLMAREAHVKAPSGMRHFFPGLIHALDIKRHFPNIHVHQGEREDFINKRAAFRRDPHSGEVYTATDVVIFTGTPEKAAEMRKEFHKRVLFITNGAGHNPIVVAENADVAKAVESAMRVQLYNQGQDCAAPNSILVHASVYNEFIRQLSVAVKQVKIGPYRDRENIIGPISRNGDLARIQKLMAENSAYISAATDGVIRTRSGIVEPTIIEKPLSEGGNFTEQFAPIFFVQKYDRDEHLARYFGDNRYRKNAMYVTVFGESPYVKTLIGDPSTDPSIFHDESTVIRNTDLHAPGIERGTKPYGGYGRGASSITMNGNTVAKPTLPQRDIFEYLVKPSLEAARGKTVETVIEHIREAVKKPRGKEDKEEQWVTPIVDEILSRFPDKSQYVVAAGASPKHPIHFGSLRDVIVSLVVCKALQKRGKNTQLLFSWDDFERLQEIPHGMNPTLEKYIGMPLSGIPDPFGTTDSYAKHFELAFEDAMRQLDISMIFSSQTDTYRAGEYDDLILEVLKRRDEYADIMLRYMSEKSMERNMITPAEFRQSYFPIIVYSRFTGKANTIVLDFDGDRSITYKCLDTGNIETVDLTQDHIAKLKWKVEWPLRWKKHNVVFEAGGVSQSIRGGSHEVATAISKEMLGNHVPVYQRYGTVTLRDAKDTQSGMRYDETSIVKLLEVYEPELLKWLYAHRGPQQDFSIGFDRDVLRQYDEFDKDKSNVGNPMPFRQVIALGQIVAWNGNKLRDLLRILGKEFDEASINSRLDRARVWMDKYNPDEAIKLLALPNTSYVETLDTSSKEYIRKLRQSLLNPNTTLDELGVVTRLEADAEISEKANQDRQKGFYRNVYQLLLGRDTGPRLPTLLWAMERERVLTLLDI